MRHSTALLLVLTMVLALFSGWTAAPLHAAPVDAPELASSESRSIKVEIYDRLRDEALTGQRYDLIGQDETRYLTTTSSGLDLGSLKPGFYYLEAVSYRKLEDGTDARIVEARDILRVRGDGRIFLNGQPMPQRLYYVKTGAQTGASGLIFRLWDKQTGVGIPAHPLQLQRLDRSYTAEELQYIKDMEAYIAALEAQPAEPADPSESAESSEPVAESADAKLAEARATLADFQNSLAAPQVVGDYTTDPQGILYLAPLEVGNYRLVSGALGNIDFSVTEEAPVAYPTASLAQPALPQWTTASLTLAGGPELQGESWLVTGQLLQDGVPLRAVAWSSAQTTVSFEDLPAYGPDRMAYQYDWKLDLPEGYELDQSQDPWVLHRATETSTEEPTSTPPPATTAPTTEPSTTETTLPTTEPSSEPTTEPFPEPTTTEPAPGTEPSHSNPTIPGHPDLTLPTLPDLTLPTADPSQPKATLPERPHANGGQIQRPQSPQRPGNLADGSGLQMGEGSTTNPVDAFKGDDDAPQTFDPGVKGSIAIAVFAVLAILVLELLQRHRDD